MESDAVLLENKVRYYRSSLKQIDTHSWFQFWRCDIIPINWSGDHNAEESSSSDDGQDSTNGEEHIR